MNINQGKAIELHYNNVARQDNETLAQIGYTQNTTVEIIFSEILDMAIENPNPFNTNYPENPVKCATPV